MKNYLNIFLAVIVLPAAIMAHPQKDYPKNYFRSPVDFGIRLSGAFADVRPNHFHSGIDIRTGGVTGKPVYAAAAGYVSRIFVSPYGFGKAIYVTHPNGYTTVYGHLNGFNSAISAWVKAKQYSKESFDLDIQVEPGVFPVKKGDIIAWSGNSGASGGPHLHFEIRDAPTQETINPVLFGLPVKDNLPPVIRSVRIYPFDGMAMINFVNAPLTLSVNGNKGHTGFGTKDTILVSGNIYFGVEVSDPSDEVNIKSGISSVTLWVDTAMYFTQSVNRFAFPETRYVNAVVDYPLLKSDDRKILRSYVAENNLLDIYGRVSNRGILNFSGNGVHKIRYVVKDAMGNSSLVTFYVRGHMPAQGRHPMEKSPAGTLFPCEQENTFTAPGCKLVIPAGALYDDLDFISSRYDTVVTNYYSNTYILQNELTPLQKTCTLSLQTVNLPVSLRDKAVIVRINGLRNDCLGGEWKDGWITTGIREFGKYSVRVDTTPPVIKPLNIYSGKNISKQTTIRVKISDNLSGIKTYRGTLNGKWILMDFDAKNSLLEYTYDNRLVKGKNDFRLVVKDGVGNQSEYRATLTR